MKKLSRCALSRRLLGLCILVLAGCSPSIGTKKSRPSLTPAARIGMIWDDPIRCEEAVSSGRRQGLVDGKLRVGSWNLRWFPDGAPGNEPKTYRATNIQWLACAITYLQYDVVGLQEVKLTQRGKNGLEKLIKELERLTSSGWKWIADDCLKPSLPHVLVLYNTDRVAINLGRSHPELDPTGYRSSATPLCPGVLRPALGAYVKSKQGGVDFHFISSQLDGGITTRDFHNRVAAWRSLDQVFAKRFELSADTDFVMAADFNSVGCPECSMPKSADEHGLLRKIIGALEPGMVPATSSVACTSYYRGKAQLVTQVIHTKAMKEAEGAMQKVFGLCRAKHCESLFNQEVPALNYLSDHCPIAFDIRDEDLD